MRGDHEKNFSNCIELQTLQKHPSREPVNMYRVEEHKATSQLSTKLSLCMT